MRRSLRGGRGKCKGAYVPAPFVAFERVKAGNADKLISRKAASRAEIKRNKKPKRNEGK